MQAEGDGMTVLMLWDPKVHRAGCQPDLGALHAVAAGSGTDGAARTNAARVPGDG